MEPSAVAARRMRTSLALAVGGALTLMTGVALMLAGLALRTEHPARPEGLTGWGLVLVILGMAIGASAAITILVDPSVHLPSAPPRPAGGPARYSQARYSTAAYDLAAYDPAEYGPATYSTGPVPLARAPADEVGVPAPDDPGSGQSSAHAARNDSVS